MPPDPPILLPAPPEAYLSACAPPFWRWEEDALVWQDGTTLTFHEELLALTRWLQPSGLPPFPALLLYLGALRGGAARAPGHAWRALQQTLASIPGSTLDARLGVDWQPRLRRLLVRFAELGGTPAFDFEDRSVLAELAFENAAERTSPEEALRVIRYLENGLHPAAPAEPFSDADILRGMDSLQRAFRDLDPDTLTLERVRLRRHTGLDHLPEPETLDPAALSTRQFLQGLREDQEFAGLARLARNLMAAVHLPRQLAQPEEMPVGGFSDISNRGSLDRLLLSELAQDDTVLAVRLALQEALYLRREAPRAASRLRRTVLVDNGLLLWGVPRLFATAMALSLCADAESDPGADVDAFAPSSHGVRPLDLRSRPGLVEALSGLETHLSPVAALQSLAERPGMPREDCIIITHADSPLEGWQQLVATHPAGRWFLITLDRSGRYSVRLFSAHGSRTLLEARADLSILTRTRTSTPLIRGVPGRDLPVILQRRPFPVLLPVPRRLSGGLETPLGLCLAGRRQENLVLHFPRGHACGQLLCPPLPGQAPLLAAGVLECGSLLFLARSPTPVLWKIDPTGCSPPHDTPLHLPRSRRILRATVVQETLILMFPHRLLSCDLASGHPLAEGRVPCRILARLTGQRPGGLIPTSRGWAKAALKNGSVPCLQFGHSPSDHLPEVRSAESRADPEPETRTPWREPAAVLWNAAALTALPDRSLCLVGKRGALHALRLDPAGDRVRAAVIAERRRGAPPAAGPAAPFRPAGDPLLQPRFDQARLRDGSTVWKDRVLGLLHLQPADRSQPECSLLIRNGVAHAWFSSGETVGDPACFPEKPTHGAPFLSDYLARFGAALAP